MLKKILIATIATAVMILVMRFQGSKLVSDVMPKGIISFEFAKTYPEAKRMMDGSNIQALKTNTYLDFLFIGAYTALLYLCCKWIINNFRSSGLKRLGWAFLELSLTVGALDILENITMLMTLSGNGSNLSTGISFWAAVLKFTFAAMVLVYLIISFIGIKVTNRNPNIVN